MITGLMDNICPPSTQFAAYNKITSKKQMTIYPDFGMKGCRGMGIGVYVYERIVVVGLKRR